MEALKNLYPLDSSKYVAEMTWDPKTILCKKEWFGEGVLVDFEGIKVKAPQNIDGIPKGILWKLYAITARRRKKTQSWLCVIQEELIK